MITIPHATFCCVRRIAIATGNRRGFSDLLSLIPVICAHALKLTLGGFSDLVFELRNLWPEFPMSEFAAPGNLPAIQVLEDIEDVALAVRQSWRLGIDAIGDLIGLLESHGILVITTDSEHADKIDGLQVTVEGVPVVVVSTAWPGCRQRFTLAHELGHLILHDLLPSDMDEEKACNRFAGAFLYPRDSVLASFGKERHGLNWKELDLLKHEFGISMSAIMFRCKDLGILNESVYKHVIEYNS